MHSFATCGIGVKNKGYQEVQAFFAYCFSYAFFKPYLLYYFPLFCLSKYGFCS